ncbi:M3 family oligoendopeptidase [Petrocella sp. FN5]|uniref:M3 family oligoendopeptidase n=1 Tax=Petrocella sp. FN5 TaxID=3032002 RepID=UPI0023DA3856|nr:M3 family oligoendopeptidase [Petrocella sp. FN5]MDF1616268.1 M3 family oligoendopeptidase [Petrocella sp. FN5]
MKQWNLDVLYTSFEDPKLTTDQNTVHQLMEEAQNYINEDLKGPKPIEEKILRYYQLMDALEAILEALGNFGQLIYSVDTKNSKALKLIETVEGYDPILTLVTVGFKKWLGRVSDLETIINSTPQLKPYAFAILNARDEAKYMLSDAEESLLSHMRNTGSNAWSKLQEATLASLTASVDGDILPISIVRSLAYDQDSEKRRRAYEAELESYKRIDTISAAALNAIKGEVITVAQKRGYASPLEMTLKNARMDQETLDAMMTAISEYLPHFRAYLKKKATMLGHDHGLPFYDLFAPIGNVHMTYTYEEAQDFIISNFSSYSHVLGDYAKKAFEMDWVDPFPKEGKASGAFCSNIHCVSESRIMANFNNNFNDVSTLAHELGHGYHGECLKDEVQTNSDYPMPLAETASIFCETIVNNAALNHATQDEAIVIIENAIMSACQVIVDIYSRYLFETELFKQRSIASLSVKELNTLMLNAQKEAYGDGLNHDSLHPYMWVCKPHYYSADYNFYNFPYAFGLLFAKGLYAMYLENQEGFIPKYDELLKATGSNNIKDVLSIVGVDAHSPDFFRASLELIKKDIDLFLTY